MMKCVLCNDREMAHGAEQGSKLCNFCWELRSRMEADPELADRILRHVLVERRSRSVFCTELREALEHHCSLAHANDVDAEELLSRYEMHSEGVRGFCSYSDEDLLVEYVSLLDKPDGNIFQGEEVMGFALWEELSHHELWKRVVENVMKERENAEASD